MQCVSALSPAKSPLLAPISKQLESAVLAAAIDCIVTLNHLGEILSFNEAAERTFGHRREAVIGCKLSEIILLPHWQEAYQLDFECFVAGYEGHATRRRLELFATRSDGSPFPIELTMVPLRMQGVRVFAAFIRDISERKHAENLQLGQNRGLNMIATGAPLPNILEEITRFAESLSSRGICSISRANTPESALGALVAPSLQQNDAVQLSDALIAASGYSNYREPLIISDIGGNPCESTYRETIRAHGFKACACWPVLDKHDKLLGILALYFREARTPNAQEEQLAHICTYLAELAINSCASQEKIRYLAHYDSLTSLPNRFLFKEYFDLALKSARRHGKKFAVLFIDLDKFKEVNDTLGHDAGDEVLRVMAQRLRSCLRHTDKIARMGGDEFYVLIEELNDGRHAAEVARKLLEEALRPVHVGDAECRLSVSIGISIYPDDGCDEQVLIKNADSAMYNAKRSGKNAYRFFSSQNGQAPSNQSRLQVPPARPDCAAVHRKQ